MGTPCDTAPGVAAVGIGRVRVSSSQPFRLAGDGQRARSRGRTGTPTSRSTRPAQGEFGMAYGARALRPRSVRSSRRSHDLPGRTGKPSTGRRDTGALRSTTTVRYARCETPQPYWRSFVTAAGKENGPRGWPPATARPCSSAAPATRASITADARHGAHDKGTGEPDARKSGTSGSGRGRRKRARQLAPRRRPTSRHAGICGSRGLQCPGYPTWGLLWSHWRRRHQAPAPDAGQYAARRTQGKCGNDA